jgi:hypothetical protein
MLSGGLELLLADITVLIELYQLATDVRKCSDAGKMLDEAPLS